MSRQTKDWNNQSQHSIWELDQKVRKKSNFNKNIVVLSMETILEQQRRYHEERERLVKLMVDEYANRKIGVSMSTFNPGGKRFVEIVDFSKYLFIGGLSKS